MKVVIIEDEPKAADQLLKLIKKCDSSTTCIGTLESVEDSIEWFQQGYEPELVFMDIQLADGLSFEIFQSVDIRTPIIFTTAFDKYAIKAFKVNSIDYLLKPIKLEELKNALEKFKASRGNVTDSQVILSILNEMKRPSMSNAFLVKSGSGFIRLSSDDIDYFYSEESISFAMSGGRRYLIDKTMDEIRQHINPSGFFRINRGQIVALSAITKIEAYFNHRLVLNISNAPEEKFIVSRAKVSEFKSWIENG